MINGKGDATAQRARVVRQKNDHTGTGYRPVVQGMEMLDGVIEGRSASAVDAHHELFQSDTLERIAVSFPPHQYGWSGDHWVGNPYTVGPKATESSNNSTRTHCAPPGEADATAGQPPNRLPDLADFLPDGLVLTDRYGQILSANPAAERLFDRAGHTLRGERLNDLVVRRFPGATGCLSGAPCDGAAWPATTPSPNTPPSPNDAPALRIRRLPAEAGGDPNAVLYLLTQNATGADATAASKDGGRDGDSDGTATTPLPPPDLLSTVSHELRTPLTALLGYSETLLAMGPAALPMATAATFLERIYMAGEHMLAIVNDLLDYSKIEAARTELHEESVNLAILLEDSIALADGHKGAARVEVSLDGPIPEVTIQGDRLRLSQVLINVIGNGIKFTPDGGRVILTAGCNDTGDLVVIVRDTGRGMSEAEVPRALEPFGQAALGEIAGRDKGTGLGLPLSKSLLALHGGDLSVTSRLNEGTAVSILLPAERIKAHGTAA